MTSLSSVGRESSAPGEESRIQGGWEAALPHLGRARQGEAGLSDSPSHMPGAEGQWKNTKLWTGQSFSPLPQEWSPVPTTCLFQQTLQTPTKPTHHADSREPVPLKHGTGRLPWPRRLFHHYVTFGHVRFQQLMN